VLISGRRSPTAATLSPLSRPLFLCVKRAQLGRIPGVAELLRECFSDLAIGPGGHLLQRGRVPLHPARLAACWRI